MQGRVVLFALLGGSGPGRPDPPNKTTTAHTTYIVCRGVWCCSLCLADRVRVARTRQTKQQHPTPPTQYVGVCGAVRFAWRAGSLTKQKNKVLLPCLHGFWRCWCCGLLALLHRRHGCHGCLHGVSSCLGVKIGKGARSLRKCLIARRSAGTLKCLLPSSC